MEVPGLGSSPVTVVAIVRLVNSSDSQIRWDGDSHLNKRAGGGCVGIPIDANYVDAFGDIRVLKEHENEL